MKVNFKKSSLLVSLTIVKSHYHSNTLQLSGTKSIEINKFVNLLPKISSFNWKSITGSYFIGLLTKGNKSIDVYTF